MKRELLEKPFTLTQIRQRKGRNGMLDYVEGHTVIQRLNEALEGEWSFEIMHHEVREEEVLVAGCCPLRAAPNCSAGASTAELLGSLRLWLEGTSLWYFQGVTGNT